MALCLSRNQANVDAIMLEIDGTPNKSKLWANAILGVSLSGVTLSVCRASAGAKGVPLYRHIKEISGTKELVMPVLDFNVINGGSHAGNNLAMQEFMILLVGAQLHLLRLSAWAVKNSLSCIKGYKEKYGQDACNVGDDGGFAPNVQDNREGLVLLMDAIEKAGYTSKVGEALIISVAYFEYSLVLIWK
ncbi:Enolase 1, chloroplastic [Glycine soja]|uniref:phosphopyruvate hydratase n=1 Tax=Glycine soja TaxID=3848 RepID=A0A0B2PV25_GLYSO|nr:Enolase 1, chloroplastic [Glycine soja]